MSESPNKLYFNDLRKSDVTCLGILRLYGKTSSINIEALVKYLNIQNIAPPASKLPSDSPRSKPGLSPEESGGFPGAKSDFPPSKVRAAI